jgi:spermidine synthase
MKQLVTALRRLISHVVPLTRRVQSEFSGPLEITLYQGRKVLDTAHANYSYGSLQRVLAYGLRFTQPETAAQMLVLGLGGGSIIQTLRQTPGFTGAITAIELDPVIIQIAQEEFDIRPDAKLDVVCADAFAWVATAPAQSFDLMVIDLFLDLALPAGLGTSGFWEHIRRLLRPGGYVLLNTLTAENALVDGRPAPEHWKQQGLTVKEVEVEMLNLLYILRKVA